MFRMITALCVGAIGCGSIQHVSVRSNAPGARVSVKPGPGGRAVDDQPLPAELPLRHYSTSRSFWNAASVGGGMALTGALLAGIGFAVGDESDGQESGFVPEPPAIAGIVIAVLGVLVAGVSVLAGGLQALTPDTDVELRVTAPGFVPTSTVVRLPLKEPRFRFDLHPLTDTSTTVLHAPAAPLRVADVRR